MGSKKSLVASSYQAPGSVVLLERATEPARPLDGGIKPTHAPSHNGEDLHVRLYIRRTAGTWDT